MPTEVRTAIYLEFTKQEESMTDVVYRLGGAENPGAHVVSIPKEGSWPDRGLIQS